MVKAAVLLPVVQFESDVGYYSNKTIHSANADLATELKRNFCLNISFIIALTSLPHTNYTSPIFVTFEFFMLMFAKLPIYLYYNYIKKMILMKCN